MVARQQDFFSKKSDHKPRIAYGGKASGRKLARPLDRRHPILITMKSNRARNKFGLLNSRHRLKIKEIIRRLAARYGVRIHRLAQLSDHLHLTASFSRRVFFQTFLRVIAGLIARLVTGAQKGKPFGKFWSSILHTRVVRGGRRDYLNTDRYVQANQLEATYGRGTREEYLLNPARFTMQNPQMLSQATEFSGAG